MRIEILKDSGSNWKKEKHSSIDNLKCLTETEEFEYWVK